jgi:hypothetical protein
VGNFCNIKVALRRDYVPSFASGCEILLINCLDK